MAKKKKKTNGGLFKHLDLYIILLLLNALMIYGSEHQYSWIYYIGLSISFVFVEAYKGYRKTLSIVSLVIFVLSFTTYAEYAFYVVPNMLFIPSLLLFAFIKIKEKRINKEPVESKVEYEEVTHSSGNEVLQRGKELTLEYIDSFKYARCTKDQGDLFEDLIALELGNNYNIIKNSYSTGYLREKGMLPDCVAKTAGSGEQGLDNVAFFHNKVVIDGIEYDGIAIQAKHYSGSAPNSAVQEIIAAKKLYSDHFRKKLYPMVVTNSLYSKDAKVLIEEFNIGSIDRDNLLDFLNGSYRF